MSRRRFFHPAQTYNSFIHSVEEYKHSREPSTSSSAAGDVALNIQPQLSDLTDPSASSPLLPPASPARPLSPLPATSQSLLPFASVGSSSAASHKHGDHIDIWLSRRNLDAVIKRKSLLIFLNGLFGILLEVALLQVGWDGQQYHDDDRKGELPMMLSIKIAMFLSSCLLVYQLLDRKQMQITIKYREKRRKTRSLIKPPLSTVSLLSLLSLRPSSFRWKLWLQCLICFFHPFPFFSPRLIPLHMSNKWGLLMFLRLHLAFRVIRDYSEIWLNRRSIKKLTAFSSRTPNFDWWLSVKTLVYRNPIAFATSFYLFCIVVFGYSVYIHEREEQPDLFTLPIGFYLAFQCITIDWASDVYDVYDPITWPGKLTCLTAAMMGLLLTSFIIGIVSQSILPSKFEEMALNCIGVEKAREKEKDNAARLIQYVWRNYRHEKELAEKLERKNPRLYEEISALEEKEFMEEFLARSKSLRNVRRERVDLEEQLMGGQKADSGQGDTGGDMRAGGAGGGDDVVDRVERLVERVVEQQEEMMRWMRSLHKEKEKRKGRRDRERQKRRKREEEERKERENKQPDNDGPQSQQILDTAASQPTEEQQKKRSRKSMRRGRGEAEAEGGALSTDAIGEVDENGEVRPASSTTTGRVGGRRRSISYSELADLEKWGEEGGEQGGVAEDLRRRGDDGDRKETASGVEQSEHDDVLGTLGRPSPLTTSTSSSSALLQPATAASGIAPLSSFRPPSSFPTLPNLGAQPRSFSLPLSAFSLFAKPQPPSAQMSLASPLASLALAQHTQPTSAASAASSSLSAPASAMSSPVRVSRTVPASSVPVDSHDDDEKQIRRARERPREQDVARNRLRATAPAAEQHDDGRHDENEIEEQLDTSLSDLTDGDDTAGADDGGVTERSRWRERERTRERRRRVRSLSPHSVALAQMAISAMGGSGGSKRRTERKDEGSSGEAAVGRNRRRSTVTADRTERDRSRAGPAGRDRDRRSLLSASFSSGDAATQRRASISGPLMHMAGRGADSGGGEEEHGSDRASGSDRGGRERSRAAGPSGRHKPATPATKASGG